jgi:hypothetical protein
LENLEEIDKFLDTYDHPKLSQENINHKNQSVTSNKIEPTIVEGVGAGGRNDPSLVCTYE